jgi:copper/silver efflux system protein
MIAGIIRWSARNVFLVGLATIFVTLAGVYAVSRVPLDAIPDLSDVQVIVYTEYPGQAPQVVEDQVTYPRTWPRSTRSRGRSRRQSEPSQVRRALMPNAPSAAIT